MTGRRGERQGAWLESARVSFTLTLQSGPAVLDVERLTADGAVLRLAQALAPGRWVAGELKHPSFAQPLAVAARVTWSQPIAPGLDLTLTALEFVGTWEALWTLRRAVLGAQASRATVGEAHVGWVVVEPGGGRWTCHGAETVKVAVVAREEKGFSVRRRDAPEPVVVESFDEALARGFAVSTAPRLEPDVEAPDPHPRPAPAAAPPRSAPAPAKAPDDEEAVLAARTLVIGERPPARASEDAVLAARTVVIDPQRPPEVDEEAVLAARTMVVVDRAPRSFDDEEEVLAARTVVLGKEPRGGEGDDRRWSKVLDGERLVGWIAPDTPEAWSIYDERGRKTAIIAALEGTVRVCWLGDKATESFEYFEASTPIEAIVAAYELSAPPRIEPPIPGL